MPIYYLVLKADSFQAQLRPALAASWRQRSFGPCRALCAALRPEAEAFARRYHTGAEEPLLSLVERGLAFDRDLWRALVGEVLLYSAEEVPEVQSAPETLCCLLAPEQYRQGDVPRERFAPIQQTHFGSRDLVFGGGIYRPEQAGYNDAADVARLAGYLAGVDPRHWTAAELADLRDAGDEEERVEEVELVREWFPALCDLYRRAAAQRRMVVCEVL